MRYRNLHLIYNPFAGKFRRHPELAESLRARLAARGHNVTLEPTNGPGSAGELARRSTEGLADLVVAVGGDGTINEVAAGLVYSETPLAILPAGTANVLAVETGIGANPFHAADQLGSWEPHRIAVGEIERSGAVRRFLLMTGAGLDARLVHDIDPNLKQRLGKLAYWLAGFSQVGRRLPEFTVRAAGREIRCSMALVTRVRNYGGDLEIARNIRLLDDDFELVLFAGHSTWPYLKYFAGILTGGLEKMKGATVLRAREAEIATLNGNGHSSICLQVDGEAAGQAPARIRALPAALTLLLPPAIQRRYA